MCVGLVCVGQVDPGGGLFQSGGLILQLVDDPGRKLLDSWAESLGETQRRIGAFLDRYEQGKEVS